MTEEQGPERPRRNFPFVLVILITCVFLLISFGGLLGIRFWSGQGTVDVTATLKVSDPEGLEHMAAVQTVLAKRLNAFGMRNRITQVGPGLFQISASLTKDVAPKGFTDLITRQGDLAFRLVHERNDEWGEDLVAQKKFPPGMRPSATLSAFELIDSSSGTPEREVPTDFGFRPGAELKLERAVEENGVIYLPVYLTHRRALTGADVKNAKVEYHPVTQAPQIAIKFNKTGAKTFERVTGAYEPQGELNPKPFGRRLAIVVDGVVLSSPTIQGKIVGGSAQISGRFTIQEARTIVAALNSGVLPTEVEVVDWKVEE